jgi:hypothetical protein
MLKRKYFFTYYGVVIPSFFVVEGIRILRFKTKIELKQNILFYCKKLFALFRKESIKWQGLSTKSLSSFDYQINEKGGIVDCNGGIHTTAQSYKNFLKDNDLVIKDWSDGSNKPKQQLSDRAEIARIVNKHI